MKELVLPPMASSLTESMRDVGYSLETAVADLIDNSITAQSTLVEIFLQPSKLPLKMAIIDNGSGMSQSELIVAMRHGSKNPRASRKESDLGRFGLGLKTASFSQCRKLTVVSKKEGVLCGASWDLDLVSEKNDWIVNVLDSGDIEDLDYVDRLTGNGTLVLWENLDRLIEGDHNIVDEKIVYDKLNDVDKHLSLVFQRYIEGFQKRPKLTIRVNGYELKAFDPFCTNNKATQLLPEEVIRVGGQEIYIQPYILPHHSKLSPNEYEYYKDRSDFLNNQGVYIYRNNRLMAWGNWFRLVPKRELTKLARVRIDFPNTLDEFWTIDIKKSRAHPPHQVREELKRILGKITDRSTRVHSGRGKRLFEIVNDPLWIRIATRGGVSYKVNEDNPAVDAFIQTLSDDQKHNFTNLLSGVEHSIPIDAIYSDYSSSPKSLMADESEEYQIITDATALIDMLLAGGYSSESSIRSALSTIKPFSMHLDLLNELIKEKACV